MCKVLSVLWGCVPAPSYCVEHAHPGCLQCLTQRTTENDWYHKRQSEKRLFQRIKTLSVLVARGDSFSPGKFCDQLELLWCCLKRDFGFVWGSYLEYIHTGIWPGASKWALNPNPVEASFTSCSAPAQQEKHMGDVPGQWISAAP